MTLRHFKIFIEVCNCNSMSVAAQKLFISQSAVSQAIKDLENHYNTLLFSRISHKLYLTGNGRKLYEYAQHMVTYNHFIEESMAEKEESLYLRVGSISGFLLTDLAVAFQREYPSSSIIMFNGLRDKIDFMLRSSSLDLAIVDGMFTLDDHEFILLDTTPMCFICRYDTHFVSLRDEHPRITLEELSHLPLLIWESNPNAVIRMETAFREHGLSYIIKGRFLHFDSVSRAVLHDLGIGLVSQANLTSDNKIYKIVEIEGLDLYFNQFLVCHRQKKNVPIIRNFIEFAQKNICALKAGCMQYENEMHGLHSVSYSI